MPYGIPDETPEQTSKMESCVKTVMAKHEGEEGFTKENAIAICKDSIMGAQIEIVQDPTEINAILGGNYLPGELLRWENMRLAYAEVNGNQDELSDDQITSIASTLPLMPLDDEHRQDAVVGIFTAARNVGGSLLTDGIIYARRFPRIAEDVMKGVRFPSIEAHADIAVCSICGGEFATTGEYCDHLRNKFASGAIRSFKGEVRGVGGAVVQNPAAKQAAWDTGAIYMVASHEIESKDKKKWAQDVDLDEGSLKELGWPSGEKIAQAVSSGKVSYAKAVRKLNYLANVSKDSGTSSKAKSIIKMLQNRFGDNKSEGGSSMKEVEEVQAELDEALSKLEKLEKANGELQATNETLQASLDSAVAKNTTLKEELDGLKSKNATLVEANRRNMLGDVLTDEEFNEQRDVIMAMSEEAVTLLAAKAKPPKPSPSSEQPVNLDPPENDAVTLS